MGFHDRLQAATAADRHALLQTPFIQAALAGRVSREGYLAFLEQAYHHVRHTAAIFMAAGARLPEDATVFRRALAEYIEEEIGHDEWILNDIAAAGGNSEAVRHGKPGLPCELMVAFVYDMVNRRHPLGAFGMVQVLEGTSIQAATPAAEALQNRLGLPDTAFTYLTSHGSLDQDHYQFFTNLMNQIEEPAAQDAILHCAHVCFTLYRQMFEALPLTVSESATPATR